ncbi:MAG TPA: 4Fe-4S dicluster domain-containing protein [Candidatus Limnocylindrales bacterium]|jgi:2-oxoglutarate ferredoxin oxidoreductase subunit delta|nr:4Fe-4S dicluster domain-containing protein [Candidatus Limnocylindrales bacterium]
MAIAGQLSGKDVRHAFAPLEIAAERCKGCGLCVDVCPKGILALDVSTVNELGYHPIRLTDAAACTSCALCARICPDTVFAVFARPRLT